MSWDTLGMTERAPGATDMAKDKAKFGLCLNFVHVLILLRGSGSQKHIYRNTVRFLPFSQISGELICNDMNFITNHINLLS